MLDDGDDGFIFPRVLGTAMIGGLKLVPDMSALCAPPSRPKSSHVHPLSSGIDLGRVCYAAGYCVAASIKASLQDQLQQGVDEVGDRV